MPDRMLDAVLDTNVWLDLLVFNDPGVAALAAAIATRQVRTFIDAFALTELERVLGYRLGRILLDATDRAQALQRCSDMASLFTRSTGGRADDTPLPVCRDPFDQPFLELARDCAAEYLVTKDRDLLRMARPVRARQRFAILTPAQFCARLAPG
jgi:putative PIN family toxin of toxin-antitoxin system